MRYRISMSVEVDARHDTEACVYANKIADLLKSPLVRMQLESDGIKLAGDGHPVVYMPQREIG